MSDRQLTAPEVAALALRILGVVILLGGLAQAALQLIGTVTDWSVWNLLGFFATLLFVGVIALPLILRSEWLVDQLFPRTDKTVGLAVSRRDLLLCGLALVGVWLLATNLPYLARLALQKPALAASVREGGMSPEVLRRLPFDALESALACVAGWVLLRYSARITDWWEAKARRDS